VALSNSDALADGVYRGHAVSRSTSTALSEYGAAISDSRAVSRGAFGGRATSMSDSLADAYGGLSTSRVEAVSGATYRGSAVADGIGVNVGGRVRYEPVNVRAISEARRFGSSRARAVEIRIGR
jgi:roadblock/LC7 domain-containing protein